MNVLSQSQSQSQSLWCNSWFSE